MMKSVSDTVYDAIVELRENNQVASRQRVAEVTGLKLSIVDDHIKRMRADGKLRLVVAGVVEPTADTIEDRAISATVLPNSRVKLEIGDTLLDLSIKEARHAAALLAGFAMQYRA